MSKTTTIANMRRDGAVVEVLADGTERAFPDTPMRPMTDEEVHAAALADPDAQPLTEERLAGIKQVPRARTFAPGPADCRSSGGRPSCLARGQPPRAPPEYLHKEIVCCRI